MKDSKEKNIIYEIVNTVYVYSIFGLIYTAYDFVQNYLVRDMPFDTSTHIGLLSVFLIALVIRNRIKSDKNTAD